MFGRKPENYQEVLEKIKRRREGGAFFSRPVWLSGALLLGAVILFGGIFLFRSLETGKSGEEETVEAQTEARSSEEQEREERDRLARQAVVDSYQQLGIVQVTGYLNLREAPDTSSDVLGKVPNEGACEILDHSTEGWYQVRSGELTGYVSAEYVLTGEAAREKALALAAKRAIITADALNIRKEPTVESEVIGQALEGERYLVKAETEDGWIQIADGYISGAYAEVAYALNEARKLDARSMVLNLYDHLGISRVDSYLNVRREPSETAEIIGKMTSKSAGEILETSEDGAWYKIKSGPVTGYVSAEYILTGPAAKDEALEVAELMAIVSTDRLNVRTEPSTEAPIWTQISNNERYNVIDQLDGWVEIELDTTSAFVSTDYVDVRYALPEAISFSPLDGNTSLRNRMVNYALQFVGNRYVWGGNDPHTGADCSGFVRYVYQHVAGVSLERVSRAQAKQGTKITSDQMRPADLIFYTDRGGTVNHVAMYIGNGQIVHAASRRSGIKISTWNYRNPYRIVNMLGD